MSTLPWRRLTAVEIDALDPIELYLPCDPLLSYGKTRFGVGRVPRDSVSIQLGCRSPHGEGSITWIDHEKRTFGCDGLSPEISHPLPKRHHRICGGYELICEEEAD